MQVYFTIERFVISRYKTCFWPFATMRERAHITWHLGGEATHICGLFLKISRTSRALCVVFTLQVGLVKIFYSCEAWFPRIFMMSGDKNRWMELFDVICGWEKMRKALLNFSWTFSWTLSFFVTKFTTFFFLAITLHTFDDPVHLVDLHKILHWNRAMVVHEKKNRYLG